MSDYLVMRAVEYEKLPAKFKKANPFDGLLAAGYWLQKKYDGCMGIATIRFDRSECTMQSRTGEDYTASTGHLLDELHDAATEQSGSFDPFIVIGEVWQPIEEASFPTISGNFRRRAACKQLRFVANDLLPIGFNTPAPYRHRFNDLAALLPVIDGTRVTVAETHDRESHVDNLFMDAKALALEWQGQGGFDGAILRNPNAGYTVGTVKQGEIIKVKPTMSLDLRVSKVTVDARETKLGGYLTVEYNGVYSDVGSGLSQDDLTSFKDELHQGNWINKIAEIECLGITADGKLREPRFKGIRHDKVKPD